jgi:hypothetical protein
MVSLKASKLIMILTAKVWWTAKVDDTRTTSEAWSSEVMALREAQPRWGHDTFPSRVELR